MMKTGREELSPIVSKSVSKTVRAIACLLFSSLIPQLVWAQNKVSEYNTPHQAQGLSHNIQTLDTAFENAFQTVRSHLIEAPEASRHYVQTAIALYNAAPLKAGHFYKRLPAQAPEQAFTPSGSWVPNGRPIIAPQWAQNTPLEIGHANRFRPPAPPPTRSPAYEAALEEVFSLGEDTSETRIADQSITARFWADGLGTISPPGRWNLIALKMSQNWEPQKKRELFLALNIALYDAGIAAWDAKYHYQYWRPQTAIAVANPNFIDWTPMMENPFHPEYVSGHSTFSGAGAGILTAFFGQQAFCMQSAAIELRGLKRCYDSFNAAADEAGLSRIYGGIHFSFSNEEGLALGRKVALHTLKRLSEQGYIALP